MGKVVHISDELHARLKKYCTEADLGLKQWAEEVLVRAVTVATTPPVDLVAVETKQLPGVIYAADEPNSWEQPPFWERGQAPSQSEEED